MEDDIDRGTHTRSCDIDFRRRPRFQRRRRQRRCGHRPRRVGLGNTRHHGAGRTIRRRHAGDRRGDGGGPRRRLRREDAEDVRLERRDRHHRGARRRCSKRSPSRRRAPSSGSATCPRASTSSRARQIQSSPAVIADDVLRQVPTFSLFRRTSSLVAQPTAQGVSLRGIGPSGQSRTLVLLDGIPFNDPFGGWVYWTRVPLESVDRIEITEDASSSLYGNYRDGRRHQHRHQPSDAPDHRAQAAVRQPQQPEVRLLRAATSGTSVGGVVEGSFLDTDGFPIVAPIERGPIDNNADVEYQNVTAQARVHPSDRVQGFVRAGYFAENRNNGKIGELNDTRWTTVSGGIRARLPDESDLQARVFGDVQRAHFNFLAVTNAATTRNIVRLATDQHVPTNGVGGMVQWSKALGRSQRVQRGVRLALGGRREPGRRLRRRAVPAVRVLRRHAGGDAVGAARLRRLAAEHRRVRAGHLHADRQAGAHAQRARRSLEQLQRPQPRDDRRDRAADRQQPPVDSRHERHRRQPARRGALSRRRIA